MIRWIVGSSLKFRYFVVAVAAALLFFGIARLPNTPVDVFRADSSGDPDPMPGPYGAGSGIADQCATGAGV